MDYACGHYILGLSLPVVLPYKDSHFMLLLASIENIIIFHGEYFTTTRKRVFSE